MHSILNYYFIILKYMKTIPMTKTNLIKALAFAVIVLSSYLVISLIINSTSRMAENNVVYPYPVCEDGTAANTCSLNNKGIMCNGNTGQLRENCEKCGCPDGKTCSRLKNALLPSSPEKVCVGGVGDNTCSDGTPKGYCSPFTKSKVCNNEGQLEDNCKSCGGCAPDQNCDANGSCVINPLYGKCHDGTPIGQCSIGIPDPSLPFEEATGKPWKCQDQYTGDASKPAGMLVEDCEECGCPGGFGGDTCYPTGKCKPGKTKPPIVRGSDTTDCVCPNNYYCSQDGQVCYHYEDYCKDGTEKYSNKVRHICSTKFEGWSCLSVNAVPPGNKVGYPERPSSGDLFPNCQACGCPNGMVCNESTPLYLTAKNSGMQGPEWNLAGYLKDRCTVTSASCGTFNEPLKYADQCLPQLQPAYCKVVTAHDTQVIYDLKYPSKREPLKYAMAEANCQKCGCPSGETCLEDGRCSGKNGYAITPGQKCLLWPEKSYSCSGPYLIPEVNGGSKPGQSPLPSSSMLPNATTTPYPVIVVSPIPSHTTLIRGDQDGNGAVDLTDALLVVDLIFGRVQAGDGRIDYRANSDVNSDGSITIADVIEIIKIIFAR
jgi:hypothetical protein